LVLIADASSEIPDITAFPKVAIDLQQIWGAGAI
jgi:hypothetical protein